MIVGAVTVALLAASVPLIAWLRTLEGDRATAVRVAYSMLVVAAYALLPVGWALGAIPTGGLAAFLTAPLAIRLGDVVSHRRGSELGAAQQDALILLGLFVLLLGYGASFVP